MLNVIRLPVSDVGDVSRGLRSLAEAIERGEYGDAHNLAYAVDCGASRIEIGMLGHAAEPGVTAHYLYALAQRKLEVI